MHQYRGVRLIVLPTLKWKYTDTLAHTLLSVVHSLFGHYDVLLLCNAANSIFAWMPRLFGTPVVVNVDGIERKRKKWNRAGQTFYHLSELLSVWFPNAIVSDARVISQYYEQRYRARSTFIPYGAATEKSTDTSIVTGMGLQPGEYFLYVSRLEPENNAHLVVAAFEGVRTEKRLAVVGDAPYSRNYIRRVRKTEDRRIVFPGAVYGEGYRQLQSHAFCYIHATEVGGTHPALLEAMGVGNLVVANGTPENREVLADSGLIYDMNNTQDLARRLQDLADCPERYAHLREAARARAKAEYSWEAVVTQYEQLFRRLTGNAEAV
jgi:glycosyltransferase involved in cell wall biosynthesis